MKRNWELEEDADIIPFLNGLEIFNEVLKLGNLFLG